MPGVLGTALISSVKGIPVFQFLNQELEGTIPSPQSNPFADTYQKCCRLVIDSLKIMGVQGGNVSDLQQAHARKFLREAANREGDISLCLSVANFLAHCMRANQETPSAGLGLHELMTPDVSPS